MKFSGTHAASAVPIFSWFTSKSVFVLMASSGWILFSATQGYISVF